jgi:hypothetical protein
MNYEGNCVFLKKQPFNSLSLDPLAPQKQKALEKAGLRVDQPFPISIKDPVPSRLLSALRIQRLQESELQEHRKALSGIVNKQNEEMVLNALEYACEDWLRSYSTTLEEDVQTLVTSNNTLSTNMRNILILRKGEKQILKNTLEKVKELQDQLSKIDK